MSSPLEGSPPVEISKTYGHVWADSLYGINKDAFMIDVYNNCKDIDGCMDPTEKATKLMLLRHKIKGSKKAWVEGILDFIDFEAQVLADGVQLDVLDDTEDSRTIAILHAAYLHGAFRGVCRTASGAEWIVELGEFCAAAIHQGFKWVRVSGGVDDWELPALGESWCKGAVLWAMVCLFMAFDIAGGDPENDAALERIHTVIGAHHMAGVSWIRYRGIHPHNKSWSEEVRGTAPSEASIRSFGATHSWPNEMIDILSQGAKHVNSWKNNQSFDVVHQERLRGLLVGDHTPRLQSSLKRLTYELAQFVDDITDAEVEEVLSRLGSWMGSHFPLWHGRDDRDGRVLEISATGAFMGVLRESRPYISTKEF